MRPTQLLRRLRAGHLDNVGFNDLDRLIRSCGFDLDRIVGSHHIYAHTDIPVKLNIQRVRRTAKPYQIRQFLAILERYNLGPEDLS